MSRPSSSRAPKATAVSGVTLLTDSTGGLWLSEPDTTYSRLLFSLGGRWKDSKKLWAFPSHPASLIALLDEKDVAAGDRRAEEILSNAQRLREMLYRLHVGHDWDSFEGPEALEPFQRAGVSFLSGMGRAILTDRAGTGKCTSPLTEVWSSRGPVPIQATWTDRQVWEQPGNVRTNPDGSSYSRPRVRGMRVLSMMQQTLGVTLEDEGTFLGGSFGGAVGSLSYAPIWRSVKVPYTNVTMYNVSTSRASIAVSPEHKFWAQVGDTVQWVEAQNLSVGQLVGCHPNIGSPSTFASPVAEAPMFLPITDIQTYTYTGDLYDLQVPGSNSWVGNGFVLHNSGQALLAVRHEPVLVLCPKSVVSHWNREVEKWLGHATPDTWLITNYESVIERRVKGHADPEGLALEYAEAMLADKPRPKMVMEPKVSHDRKWGTLIVDEAHNVVNRKSGRSKAVSKIAGNSRDVFLLSGTPMRSGSEDLWHLLHIVDPDRWSSYWSYLDEYMDVTQGPFGKIVEAPDEKTPIGRAKVEALQKALYPYMMGRDKVEVLGDRLPPISFQDVEDDLLPHQRKAYDEFLSDMEAQVECDPDGTVPVVTPNALAQLIRLRQTCLSLALLGGKKASGRLERLRGLVEGLDEPVVVFTAFAGFAKLIVEESWAQARGGRLLIGECSAQQRDEAQAAFRNGSCRLLAVSIRAGGQGIDLTTARTAIATDVEWTPLENSQAWDRLWRRGQTRPVQILRLYSPGTAEEHIRKVLEHKDRAVGASTVQREVLARLLRRER